jgi:hypothetical protein
LHGRVSKYVLVMGGLCATLGAAEGAVIGSILAPRQDSGSLILTIAFDRGCFLGLLGAGFGAVVGALDWYLGSRRKRPSADAGRSP